MIFVSNIPNIYLCSIYVFIYLFYLYFENIGIVNIISFHIILWLKKLLFVSTNIKILQRILQELIIRKPYQITQSKMNKIIFKNFECATNA